MTKQARKKKVIVEKFIKNIIKDCIKKHLLIL
jgi:hypothetical protein